MKHTKRFLTLWLTGLLLLTGCSAGQTGAASSPAESTPPAASSTSEGLSMSPIELGNGLVLTELSAASGTFPEDGSNTPVSNILCATFVNNGSATLQYAAVTVSLNGTDHSFQISTIPAGGTVHAFDLDMQAAPDSIDEVSAAAEHVLFFPEEPSPDAERLQVTFSEESISVRNISSENIDQEISVYYKTVVDGVYMGGITYRTRVGTLAAGQEIIGHSSHARSSSELMFVTYEN